MEKDFTSVAVLRVTHTLIAQYCSQNPDKMYELIDAAIRRELAIRKCTLIIDKEIIFNESPVNQRQ